MNFIGDIIAIILCIVLVLGVLAIPVLIILKLFIFGGAIFQPIVNFFEGWKQKKEVEENKKLKEENRKRLLEKEGQVKEKINNLYSNYVDNINSKQLPDYKSITVNEVYLDNDEKYPYMQQIEKDINSKNLFKNIEDTTKFKKVHNKLKNFYKAQEVKGREDILYKNISQLYFEYKEFVEWCTPYMDKFKNDIINTRRGYLGEKAVNEELELYDDRIINVQNIRLEVDGKSIETDNFIISPYGLYSIEVKNLGISGSYSLKIDEDGRWNKVTRKGAEYPIDNITSQTFRHIGLSQKLLSRELKKLGHDQLIDIKPIIVLANEVVDIENKSDIPVVRISNIYHEITKKPTHIPQEIMHLIKPILLENKKPLNKYGIQNFKYVFNVMESCLNHYCEKLDSYENIIDDFINNDEEIA